MLSWDSILITVLHDDGVVVQDEYSYSLDAEQRMITFAGNKGDKGDPGEAATIQIGTVTTLPAGSSATVENVGTDTDAVFNFGIPKGTQGDPGSDVWGAITGTLSDQTDLQTALNAKQDSLTFDNTPTASSGNPVTSGGIKIALEGKQNTLTFDSTPTAGSTNPVTSGGIKTYVDSHADFLITGTVSSSGYTLTDARIDDSHWEVDWVYFSDPSKVTTEITCSTNITNHTVTLSATYTSSTNCVVNMHWVQ